ncbi:rod shape-determining protein MreD [Nibrella saemangeumensis]|uniref:Rod shape-determining protein MreD n=1 Tax=Nibrella saemangeumensis TaxID=1084526 RepID=A0ABP8M8Z4_9BACT
MTIREIINIIFLFILYLALQILIVRNLVLFDFAFSFIYIACILLLPIETSTTALLLIGFATGVIIDTFYNTLGMHAAATVLMAYLRPLVVRIQLDPRVQESRLVFSLQGLGSAAFFRYVFVLALIHHAALFYIEASSITLFFPTLLRTVASSLFSTICIVLIQFFTRN